MNWVVSSRTLNLPGPELTGQEVTDWVRARLRSAKAPQEVYFRTELPRTEMGELIRRDLIAGLPDASQTSGWKPGFADEQANGDLTGLLGDLQGRGRVQHPERHHRQRVDDLFRATPRSGEVEA